MSTADLDFFKHIKDFDSTYDITSFVPGREIQISWSTADGGVEVVTYLVDRIEIHQIKYDLDKPTYGENSNDCTEVFGREKKWLMEIYVFLKVVKP